MPQVLSAIDWQAARAEFASLENWTYLNTATYGQMPRRGVEAATAHWQRRIDNACADFLDWYEDTNSIRADIARLINATSDDIAFLNTTSAILATIVNGLRIGPDDNVVTLGDEFPNQLYLPNVRPVAWEQFYGAINERTRLVAISEVNYATGFRAPVKEIARFCRERGVILYVDGAQSVGALKFDVRETQVDILGVHAYKWMCSPTAVGFMYIAPPVREKIRPTVVGWRSDRQWRNVDHLQHGAPTFKDTAEKYEGGGLPFSLLDAMHASAAWMNELGPENIEERVLGLAESARKRLRALGGEAHDTGSQIATAKFPGVDPSRLAVELRKKRVIVAARHGFLRVAPHFYNNESDLDTLVAELRRLL